MMQAHHGQINNYAMSFLATVGNMLGSVSQGAMTYSTLLPKNNEDAAHARPESNQIVGSALLVGHEMGFE